MSCRRRRSLLALVLSLAGCGSTAPQRPAGQLPVRRAATGPCAGPAETAVAAAAGGAAVRTRVTDVSPGQATCVYAAGRMRVVVQVDGNPQAEKRFERAVVERGQNSVWGHNRAKAPRQLQGIGDAADWFPADRELLTTDGRRLISVKLAGAPSPLRLGRAVARATLSV